MNFKIFILIISSLMLNQFAFAQKFRTLEQYQEYFLKNYKSLDKIEGIWYKSSKKTIDGYVTNLDPLIVAIIKEGNVFKEYRLKDGYYTPKKGSRSFKYTRSGYQYNHYEATNYTFYGEYFYLYGENMKFSFKMGVLNLVKNQFKERGGNPNSIKSAFYTYSYSKMYPLESDFENYNKPIQIEKSTGTGFAISSDGYIVTNYHVVENASKIKVKGINGDFSKSYSAKVMVSDKNNDLAILKIDDYSFSTLGAIPYMIKNISAKTGESIFVLGYPLTATMGEEIKLTNGIISSKSGFQRDITSYQMTAPIQPGNSGAPMFDKNGNIIGIVNAKHIGAENAGYAVKTSYLFNLIDALPTTIKMPTANTLKGKTLSSQVELANKFVYIIEVE